MHAKADTYIVVRQIITKHVLMYHDVRLNFIDQYIGYPLISVQCTPEYVIASIPLIDPGRITIYHSVAVELLQNRVDGVLPGLFFIYLPIKDSG